MKREPAAEQIEMQPLTEVIMTPREWRCGLPAHVRKLVVTERMADTFHNEAQMARSITTREEQ